MKWIAKFENQKSLTFEIRQDKYAGYYLYVYENGIDTHDYLQDTLEVAIDQAFEEFGVPKNVWKKVE